jgi:outer membrane protein OmpA-like peptidoglycan-associated protein
MAQIPNEIMFAFDSDQLRPNASNILAECAELIKREHGKRVHVIGHSDSVGRVDYNLELLEASRFDREELVGETRRYRK